jgi:hypothetical protein
MLKHRNIYFSTGSINRSNSDTTEEYNQNLIEFESI